MAKYTTGDIAKLCGVSVRTVQYYDTRKILVPSELSEGGRRLYSEKDLQRMKIVCFLREAGFSINGIAELFEEEHPEGIISVLLEERKTELCAEIDERKKQLAIVESMQSELRTYPDFSVETIGDIAYLVKNKRKLRALHMVMFAIGIPLGILQWSSVIFWIMTGNPWLFAAWAVLDIVGGICSIRFYMNNLLCICPTCHARFQPPFKEAFFAKHTPKYRRVTCPHCGFHGFCAETYGKEENEND